MYNEIHLRFSNRTIVLTIFILILIGVTYYLALNIFSYLKLLYIIFISVIMVYLVFYLLTHKKIIIYDTGHIQGRIFIYNIGKEKPERIIDFDIERSPISKVTLWLDSGTEIKLNEVHTRKSDLEELIDILTNISDKHMI